MKNMLATVGIEPTSLWNTSPMLCKLICTVRSVRVCADISELSLAILRYQWNSSNDFALDDFALISKELDSVPGKYIILIYLYYCLHAWQYAWKPETIKKHVVLFNYNTI